MDLDVTRRHTPIFGFSGVFPVVAAFLLLAGCSAPPRRAFIGGTLHMPLLQERILRYAEHDGNEMTEYTVRFEYLGGHRSKVFAARFKGIKPEVCEIRSTDSLLVFSTEEPPFSLERPGDLPEYRQTWIREEASVGDVWVDSDMGTQTLYAGEETVTVPAGTYEHCYKTVVETLPAVFDSLKAWRSSGLLTARKYQRAEGAARKVVVRWFAPRVGLVKEQIGSPDHTRELVAVVAAGYGEPEPETPPDTVQ